MQSDERPADDVARWQKFDRTLAEVRERFADVAEDNLQALIDEALSATREAH